MEHVTCPVCGSDRQQRLYATKDYNMGCPGVFTAAKCGECSLVFLSPRPGKSELSDFYPEQRYFAKGDLHLERKRTILKRHIRDGNGARILDVGCGYPLLLAQLKSEGWKIRGLDRSRQVAAWAQSDFGITLDVGDINEVTYPEYHFDVITFWHSLEHLPSPVDTLRKIVRWLKKDGIVVVCVPNIDSIQANVFKGMWYHVDAPRHLCHFSISTFNRMFHQSGFTQVDRDYRFFVDTYYGWMISLLNVLHLNAGPKNNLGQKIRDIKWVVSLPLKIILILPVLLISAVEEILNKGASVTVTFRKKGV